MRGLYAFAVALIFVVTMSKAHLDLRQRYRSLLGGGKADCIEEVVGVCGGDVTAIHHYYPATTINCETERDQVSRFSVGLIRNQRCFAALGRSKRGGLS
jgi:hypothetical protein